MILYKKVSSSQYAFIKLHPLTNTVPHFYQSANGHIYLFGVEQNWCIGLTKLAMVFTPAWCGAPISKSYASQESGTNFFCVHVSQSVGNKSFSRVREHPQSFWTVIQVQYQRTESRSSMTWKKLDNFKFYFPDWS